MKTRLLHLTGILFLVVLPVWISAVVRAAPLSQVQQFASPTPGQDGRILYVVKPGETCLEISLEYGVSVDYIRTTNHLDVNCTLQSGSAIMIGVGGPSAASPTPGPSPTPTPVLPTATPSIGGTAEVCVLLYNDINGDGMVEAGEPAIAGGAVSLTSLTGTYSQTQTTVLQSDPTAYQGICFTGIPEGRYTVSAAVPDGYNATTTLSYTLDSVKAGQISYVDFGAQPKTNPNGPSQGSAHSPLLGIFGAIFLLGGIGLGIYAWRVMRR
jgi:hypothetical protein